jgi:hypothetical protein
MQINNAKEYAQAVATFDQDRINRLIDQIPSRVNRTGKTYRRLVAKIRKEYEQRLDRTTRRRNAKTYESK